MTPTINFVAEAGQTMRGDVDLACEMVQRFGAAGATHFKVQMLNPEMIAAEGALSYWHTGPEVEQRQSFVDNGVIPHAGWGRVREACGRAGIGFVATPFDFAAVKALADLDPAAVKIASGDITNIPLLESVAAIFRSRVPILLSTGASTRDEVVQAIRIMERYFVAGVSPVVPLACTLNYPTGVDETNLGRIHDLRGVCGTREVGYSDHTVDAETALGAVCAGATWLEKHVTPHPVHPKSVHDLHGRAVPDDLMGLGVHKFAEYVDYGHLGAILLGGGLAPTESEQAARVGARRAARFRRDMPAGVNVSLVDLSFLRSDPHGDGRSIALACAGVYTMRPVVAGEIVNTENVVRRPGAA